MSDLNPDQALAASAAAAEETPKADKKTLNEIYETVAKAGQVKAADYRQLIRHTGSLVAGSMTIAYTKGVLDTLALLHKEIKNDK